MMEERMSNRQDANTVPGSTVSNSNRVGFYSAILTPVITIITFALAMTAIPISGANCPRDCVEYPYLDTVSQYPKDFLWMFAAMLLVLVYVALMVSIHSYADNRKKVFSQIGLSFAMIAAVVLLIDYYLQLSVVPVSLMNAETEGLAMLIQYNPHGIFLALEELGYLMMSLSFLFMATALSSTSRLESAIRWIFAGGFVLVIISLAGISIIYGLERLDRFEIVAISIDWLILVINGVLLAILFRRQTGGMEHSVA
jgi:hypothetical protein